MKTPTTRPPAPEQFDPRNPAQYSASVLVVEDSSVNQMVAARLLQLFGCRVETASDGHEGVEKARAGSFDLILLDFRMPGLSGHEAARAIRAQESATGRHTPIVAMTAETLASDEAQLEAGMDGFLPKPISAQSLDAVLSRWLGATPPAPSRAGGPVPPPARRDSLRLDTLRELFEMGDGGGEALEELVEMFLTGAPRQLHSLRRAIVGGNPAEVEEKAHALKSSCFALGAAKMSGLCDRLEEKGRNEDLDGALGLMAALTSEFTWVRSALLDKPWSR